MNIKTKNGETADCYADDYDNDVNQHTCEAKIWKKGSFLDIFKKLIDYKSKGEILEGFEC